WPLLQRQAGREEAFAGFASRVVGEFAQAVAARLEVSCVALDGAEAGVVRPADLFRLDIDAGGGVQYEIFAAIPPALAVALENDEARRIAASVDLLLDVELPVSVSFGRTLLPVREVLRMTTGSMIELNRNVNDYVDVIVNNCVIARGEVVVIEGNYGIRVHEIVSRRERAMLQHIGRGAPLQPLVKASV
ncbi:MAG TPA: flagellar motor switch protein FliN, partial [Bryobacteraceae bacterium]|nr:flagellar motor switch protein FliN [Bryobacteraceae bacterium]